MGTVRSNGPQGPPRASSHKQMMSGSCSVCRKVCPVWAASAQGRAFVADSRSEKTCGRNDAGAENEKAQQAKGLFSTRTRSHLAEFPQQRLCKIMEKRLEPSPANYRDGDWVKRKPSAGGKKCNSHWPRKCHFRSWFAEGNYEGVPSILVNTLDFRIQCFLRFFCFVLF